MLINAKLFQTSTFRLAAIYLLVFALSVASVLAYVYWNTVRLLEQQTDDTIRAEVLGLADQYNILGLNGVASLIKRRSTEDIATLYALVSPDGRLIAGNLKGLPEDPKDDKSGWIDFPITLTKGSVTIYHTARGYHTDLPGDYEVLVGRDVQELRQFGDLIRQTLFFALGLTILLGLGGGLLTSRNFLRRIDAIVGTSRNIMAGDLSHRIPVIGTNDELDRLSFSLNEMLDQIERLMAGMKEVSSNVAHDLKTPLTRMRARVEGALRTDNKDEYRAALTKTIEESDRLLQTFNALLSIARAEAGHNNENMQVIDLAELLTDVVELYEPMAEATGGSLVLHTSQNLMVRADRQLFAQAVSNLIDNALKYGEGLGEGSVITVEGTQTDSEVQVSIADKGVGIPPQDRERVKDRFVRLDESRHKPGNGLGLSLVAGVMKLHGGTLVLEDNMPGLRAKLVLPLQKPVG